MRRHLLATATVAVAALSLAACGTTEPSSDDAAAASGKPAEKITLTDAKGTKVTLDGPATKVVATEWNVVEDLVALGVDPVGVADVKGYTAWNTAAPLTGTPKDIGTAASRASTPSRRSPPTSWSPPATSRRLS